MNPRPHKKLIFTYILVLLLSNLSLHAQVIAQDSLALVSFYNSTDGSNWDNNTGWLTTPVPQWYGITVEGDRVTKIIINNNNLNGTLTNDLCDLSVLNTLGLSNDEITGILPNCLFNITNLEWLGIGNCINLKELSLPLNNLSGSIPVSLANLTNLEFLNLHDNQLTGSIPTGLGNLTQLLEINLKNNLLTGDLPADIGNCCQEDFWFDVSHNQLTGAILQEYADNLPTYIGYFYHFHPKVFQI